MYFYGLRGRQAQVPPRAAHTLATPLPLLAHTKKSHQTFVYIALTPHISSVCAGQ